MFFDFIYLILLILALFKGYKKGIVVALFSVLALIVGLIAALRLSDHLAGLMLNQQALIAARWTPLISHVLVFIIVVILIRLIGKALRKSLKLVLLGWVDRLAGAMLYGLMITFVCSAFLWMSTKMDLLKPEVLEDSKSSALIAPVAPSFISLAGQVIPVVQSSYDSLNDLFEQLNHKLSQHVDSD